MAPFGRRYHQGAWARQQPAERKEPTHELGYTRDTGDSATLNVWLQKALMKKLAENGGAVPAELQD